MAKLTGEPIKDTFQPHSHRGEERGEAVQGEVSPGVRQIQSAKRDGDCRGDQLIADRTNRRMGSMASCPFCDSTEELAAGKHDCPSCGHDRTAPRRFCGDKQRARMTPKAENACVHCGQNAKSELRWKIPVIILLFVLAFAIALVVAILEN